MKILALALRFLLELAALGALLAAGVAIVGGYAGWLVGLGALLVAAAVWGLFVAPRARIEVNPASRFTIELAVFAAACVGLVFADHPWLAACLGGLYVIDRLMLALAGAPLFEKQPWPPSDEASGRPELRNGSR